jgi:hypothetical protein
MKSRINQQGSTHVAIILVLVVALVGTLGFVFWQNFSKTDVSDTPEASTETVNDNEPAIETVLNIPAGYTMYENEALGFSLSYPSQWGDLRSIETQPNISRQGANGENTTALAGSGDTAARISVYTKDSFFTQNAAGYVTRYQASKLVGAEYGMDTSVPVEPITGTNVYAHDHGDAGFTAYDIFFEVGDSVVYVNVGDSKDTQTQIAQTVDVK